MLISPSCAGVCAPTLSAPTRSRPPGRTERGISHRKEEVHMRSYEVMFIAHPDLDDTSLNALLDKAKGWVTAGGGTVAQVDLWGRRRLAYPIHKQKEGQYILMQTQMEAKGTHELERNLRLNEQVMRFQVIRTDE